MAKARRYTLYVAGFAIGAFLTPYLLGLILVLAVYIAQHVQG